MIDVYVTWAIIPAVVDEVDLRAQLVGRSSGTPLIGLCAVDGLRRQPVVAVGDLLRRRAEERVAGQVVDPLALEERRPPVEQRLLVLLAGQQTSHPPGELSEVVGSQIDHLSNVRQTIADNRSTVHSGVPCTTASTCRLIRTNARRSSLKPPHFSRLTPSAAPAPTTISFGVGVVVRSASWGGRDEEGRGRADRTGTRVASQGVRRRLRLARRPEGVRRRRASPRLDHVYRSLEGEFFVPDRARGAWRGRWSRPRCWCTAPRT